jgi:hypothetical protein
VGRWTTREARRKSRAPNRQSSWTECSAAERGVFMSDRNYRQPLKKKSAKGFWNHFLPSPFSVPPSSTPNRDTWTPSPLRPVVRRHLFIPFKFEGLRLIAYKADWYSARDTNRHPYSNHYRHGRDYCVVGMGRYRSSYGSESLWAYGE